MCQFHFNQRIIEGVMESALGLFADTRKTPTLTSRQAPTESRHSRVRDTYLLGYAEKKRFYPLPSLSHECNDFPQV